MKRSADSLVGLAPDSYRRKLADALTCPKDGEGFAADKGGQTLKVATGGAWKATVEQQVDAPLIEAAPAGRGAAKVLGTAKVYNVDREGEGTAKIYELADGTRLIRLEDFFVTINSDLELRLSELPNPGREVVGADGLAGARVEHRLRPVRHVGGDVVPARRDRALGQRDLRLAHGEASITRSSRARTRPRPPSRPEGGRGARRACRARPRRSGR